MAQWVTVAEGASFSDIERLVEDRDLPKGTKIRAVLAAPGYDWAFDMAGMELVFAPFIPSDVDILDVYGEGGYGYIDMEVDPPIHIAALLAVIAKWGAIALVAGLILAGIVSFIYIMIKVPAAAAIPVALLVGAAIGIVAIVALSAYARKPVKGGKT